MKIVRQALVELSRYSMQFHNIWIIPSMIHAICRWSLHRQRGSGHKHFIHDSKLFGMLRDELVIVRLGTCQCSVLLPFDICTQFRIFEWKLSDLILKFADLVLCAFKSLNMTSDLVNKIFQWNLLAVSYWLRVALEGTTGKVQLSCVWATDSSSVSTVELTSLNPSPELGSFWFRSFWFRCFLWFGIISLGKGDWGLLEEVAIWPLWKTRKVVSILMALRKSRFGCGK